MSYDLYLWAEADGDLDDLLDAVGEDEGPFEPDPRLNDLVAELQHRWPDLDDVIEAGPDGDGPLAWVVVTLPFTWADRAEDIARLAASRGLRGWDPQAEEPVGDGQPGRSGRRRPGLDGAWTVDDLQDIGVSRRRLAAAWDLAGLPATTTFGRAAGAFFVASAMRDGERPTPAEARRVVDEVASLCADGLPRQEAMIAIGSVWIDIGFARAVAEGGYH